MPGIALKILEVFQALARVDESSWESLHPLHTTQNYDNPLHIVKCPSRTYSDSSQITNLIATDDGQSHQQNISESTTRGPANVKPRMDSFNQRSPREPFKVCAIVLWLGYKSVENGALYRWIQNKVFLNDPCIGVWSRRIEWFAKGCIQEIDCFGPSVMI